MYDVRGRGAEREEKAVQPVLRVYTCHIRALVGPLTTYIATAMYRSYRCLSFCCFARATYLLKRLHTRSSTCANLPSCAYVDAHFHVTQLVYLQSNLPTCRPTASAPREGSGCSHPRPRAIRPCTCVGRSRTVHHTVLHFFKKYFVMRERYIAMILTLAL